MSYAAQGNHVDSMAVLVRAGAELERTSDNGWSPAMYAAALGSTEAVRWLLEQGVEWWSQTDRRGRNALSIAREYQRPDPAAVPYAAGPFALVTQGTNGSLVRASSCRLSSMRSVIA